MKTNNLNETTRKADLKANEALERLRYHVTGAIERKEKTAITEIAPWAHPARENH